jgi:hypothetical protein
MRKSEKVERLRLPFSALLPVLGRERAELQAAFSRDAVPS